MKTELMFEVSNNNEWWWRWWWCIKQVYSVSHPLMFTYTSCVKSTHTQKNKLTRLNFSKYSAGYGRGDRHRFQSLTGRIKTPCESRILRSHASRGGFLVWEEAPEQNHLTDADHEEDEGLADGPEGHSSVEIFSSAAALSLSQPEVRLIVDHGFQGLVNGDAGRLHLKHSNIMLDHVLSRNLITRTAWFL